MIELDKNSNNFDKIFYIIHYQGEKK
jgi:hypothetical protein